jgi:hypothetical protein
VVAQFILDNACRVGYPKKGINNVRGMKFHHGTVAHGIEFRNGYLIPTRLADVTRFHKLLKDMTVVGTRDVATNGYDPRIVNNGEFGDQRRVRGGPTVDLVYASAAPVDGEYNAGGHPNKTAVGNAVLFGQYVCALRVAIARGNCDAILMPLGGGVFGNEPRDIKNAMKLAVLSLRTELHESDVQVKVLAYEGKATEVRQYRETR